ncbi:UNKNOWN [Stylonychia lemnae]|uniref:Uncharacterized protein n=1 Tax=Stylonychia lemnae TaxID=5949 RepID=A0A078AA65_STYLE|nr:UNKNOWN [Stylonychia lemnae]|eukprot:CDW77708.1 UNKNOWN [Stylonychia lemnae]
MISRDRYHKELNGVSDVLYFIHDYCAKAADKNTFIQGNAKLAKKHGIKKHVAVCPVEYELYQLKMINYNYNCKLRLCNQHYNQILT